jgi:DNA-binding IclR family transcriptional regulator
MAANNRPRKIDARAVMLVCAAGGVVFAQRSPRGAVHQRQLNQIRDRQLREPESLDLRLDRIRHLMRRIE